MNSVELYSWKWQEIKLKSTILQVASQQYINYIHVFHIFTNIRIIPVSVMRIFIHHI